MSDPGVSVRSAGHVTLSTLVPQPSASSAIPFATRSSTTFEVSGWGTSGRSLSPATDVHDELWRSELPVIFTEPEQSWSPFFAL